MATAGPVSLATIRANAKDRADMVNSAFVTDPTWLTYINSALAELYGILVGAYGNDYFASFSTPQQTDGTTMVYPLPADFFKLLGVDQQVTGPGQWVNVPPFMVADRNRFSNYAGQPPPSGLTFRLIYIPRPYQFAGDGDTFDFIAGWDDYVTIRAAIKALIKEESDPSALAGELSAVKDLIVAGAENRDAGNPPTVTDLQSINGGGPGLGFGAGSLGMDNYGYGIGLGGVPSMRYRLSGSGIWLIGGPF